MVSERQPARLWLGWAAVGLLTTAAAVHAQTTTSAPQQPTAAAPQACDDYTFTADQMMLAFTVAEAGSTDFEVFMGKVKEGMSKSDRPERKQQAASWKMLMKIEPAQAGNFTYLWILDPVAKGTCYDLFKLLAESLPPEEVKVLYDKMLPTIKGISRSPVKMIGPSGGLQ